ALMVAPVALTGLALPPLAQQTGQQPETRQQQQQQQQQKQRQQGEVRDIGTDRDGRITRQEYMQHYESQWQEFDRNATGSESVAELERKQREKEARKGMYNQDDWRRDRSDMPRQ